ALATRRHAIPPGCHPRRIPMHQTHIFSRRLSSEWLRAVGGAQSQSTSHRPEPPVPVEKDRAEAAYGHSLELRTLIEGLKAERTLQGLSLGEVARMTEVARSALSRLESGEYCNPTLHTLFRYAHALGCRIELSTRPLSDESGADTP